MANNNPGDFESGTLSGDATTGFSSRKVQDVIDELNISMIGVLEQKGSGYIMRLLNDGIQDLSVNLQVKIAWAYTNLISGKRIYSMPSANVVPIDIVKIEIKDSNDRYVMVPKITDHNKIIGAEIYTDTNIDASSASTTFSNPNDDFGWYADDDNFMIVYNKASDNDSNLDAGQWDTYNGGNNYTDAIRIEYHSSYIKAETTSQDLNENLGIPIPLHASLIDYIKSRIHEDMGSYETAAYHYKKYKNQLKQYPARFSGVRVLSVPKL